MIILENFHHSRHFMWCGTSNLGIIASCALFGRRPVRLQHHHIRGNAVFIRRSPLSVLPPRPSMLPLRPSQRGSPSSFQDPHSSLQEPSSSLQSPTRSFQGPPTPSRPLAAASDHEALSAPLIQDPSGSDRVPPNSLRSKATPAPSEASHLPRPFQITSEALPAQIELESPGYSGFEENWKSLKT